MEVSADQLNPHYCKSKSILEKGAQDWSDSTDVVRGIMAHDTHDKLFEANLNLQLASDSSYLGQWSSNPYFYSRNDQDAWNPLMLTGVPAASIAHMNVPVPADYCYSHHPYSEPSENGSQHLDSYTSADSGYGGASCATQSVVASNYADSSPPQERDEATCDFQFTSGSPSTSEFVESPSMRNGSIRCDHRSCSWVGKCPSDKRKHEARHRKLFKCDEPNCPRKEGFGTINDLARHKKCVHNKEPERGPKMMYMCFGKHCPRPNKRWPRLDNFKQHLSRMHPDEAGKELLNKSMDWYEQVIARPGQSFGDTSSRDMSVLEAHEEMASVQSTAEIEMEPSFVPQNTDTLTFGTEPNSRKNSASAASMSHFSTLSPLGLADQESPIDRIAKAEGSITDAADNLINAMAKMMNNRGRRSSQTSDEGVDLVSDNTRLSRPQRQMLHKVLSVALERLSDKEAIPESEKQGWFQCDACPKQTRLRCEMKKHQKRHERPYGCTFPHCAKSFGSKADWKRHETSQHLNVPSWLCTAHDPQKGPCERLFHRQDVYMQHLRQHGMQEYYIASAEHTRLDLTDQSDFWCGFCSRRVMLRSRGAAALDERFNHIDVEHFKKGERGQDWILPVIEMDDVKPDKKRKFANV